MKKFLLLLLCLISFGISFSCYGLGTIIAQDLDTGIGCSFCSSVTFTANVTPFDYFYVVGVEEYSATDVVSSVIMNLNQPLIKFRSFDGGTSMASVSVWYTTYPPIGNHSITVSTSIPVTGMSTEGAGFFGALSLSNTTSSTSLSSPLSLTINVQTAGNYVLAFSAATNLGSLPVSFSAAIPAMVNRVSVFGGSSIVGDYRRVSPGAGVLSESLPNAQTPPPASGMSGIISEVLIGVPPTFTVTLTPTFTATPTSGPAPTFTATPAPLTPVPGGSGREEAATDGIGLHRQYVAPTNHTAQVQLYGNGSGSTYQILDLNTIVNCSSTGIDLEADDIAGNMEFIRDDTVPPLAAPPFAAATFTNPSINLFPSQNCNTRIFYRGNGAIVTLWIRWRQ